MKMNVKPELGTPVPAHEPLVLSVPGLHCAGCIRKVENAVGSMPGVIDARANLSRKQVTIEGHTSPGAAIRALHEAGFESAELDAETLQSGRDDKAGRDLLLRLAVAGFAMMNVMLLSVAVWSGAEATTRDMFHWISAAISLPVVVYSAQPFFRSAWTTLRVRRLNMDVPISLAIGLAAGMSLYETGQSGEHAYFDAALSLTFFLLIGRYLDHRSRSAARSAAADLTALESRRVTRIEGEGEVAIRPAELAAGDMVLIRPGERITVDGVVRQGTAMLDQAMLTGETRPVPVGEGSEVSSGEINLDGRLHVEVTRIGEDTTMRRLAALIELAEHGRDRYTALADQAARIYAPVVHLLAFGAFIAWAAGTGDIRFALNVAIAVLIITCPCALGLAVPAVVTVATGRLFRRGFLIRHQTALERLGQIDTVVFDKTGTLTLGQANVDTTGWSPDECCALAALSRASDHPIARSVREAGVHAEVASSGLSDVREFSGLGVEGVWSGVRARLGKGEWVSEGASGTAFQLGGRPVREIAVEEQLRPGAADIVPVLQTMGLEVHLASGDSDVATAKIADALGIDSWSANMRPQEKVALLEDLATSGNRVLMVGDGLNDTGALAAAHASLAPASALDASRSAADIVLLREGLDDLPALLTTGGSVRSRIRQNFGLAVCYNLVAVPMALAGIATPLMAALAMSTSSITVVLNALRKGPA